MAKPEWGIKRTCPSCATRFYDLRRDPIVCPNCAAVYDPDAVLRSRRSRPVAEEKRKAVPVVDAELVDEAVEEVEADDIEASDEETEDEELIEDASELVDDEDEVIEVVEEDEEEGR